MAVIHVDDILVTSKGTEKMNQVMADVRSRFKIKYLAEATYCMGCHTSQDRQERDLRIDQHLYAEAVVDRFAIVKTSMIPVTP